MSTRTDVFLEKKEKYFVDIPPLIWNYGLFKFTLVIAPTEVFRGSL